MNKNQLHSPHFHAKYGLIKENKYKAMKNSSPGGKDKNQLPFKPVAVYFDWKLSIAELYLKIKAGEN